MDRLTCMLITSGVWLASGAAHALCRSDNDCPGGDVCAVIGGIGTCVPAPECTVDDDCGAGQACVDAAPAPAEFIGACVPCDCGALACLPIGVIPLCVAPSECTSDRDCEGSVCVDADPRDNGFLGRCVACADDADCEAGEFCHEHTCGPPQGAAGILEIQLSNAGLQRLLGAWGETAHVCPIDADLDQDGSAEFLFDGFTFEGAGRLENVVPVPVDEGGYVDNTSELAVAGPDPFVRLDAFVHPNQRALACVVDPDCQAAPSHAIDARVALGLRIVGRRLCAQALGAYAQPLGPFPLPPGFELSFCPDLPVDDVAAAFAGGDEVFRGIATDNVDRLALRVEYGQFSDPVLTRAAFESGARLAPAPQAPTDWSAFIDRRLLEGWARDLFEAQRAAIEDTLASLPIDVQILGVDAAVTHQFLGEPDSISDPKIVITAHAGFDTGGCAELMPFDVRAVLDVDAGADGQSLVITGVVNVQWSYGDLEAACPGAAPLGNGLLEAAALLIDGPNDELTRRVPLPLPPFTLPLQFDWSDPVTGELRLTVVEAAPGDVGIVVGGPLLVTSAHDDTVAFEVVQPAYQEEICEDDPGYLGALEVRGQAIVCGLPRVVADPLAVWAVLPRTVDPARVTAAWREADALLLPGSGDADGDGVPNADELGTSAILPDTDRDGHPDVLELDDDADGHLEPWYDTDGDGVRDGADVDADDSGPRDAFEGAIDLDLDALPDWRDDNDVSAADDPDGDQVATAVELAIGRDPTVPESLDSDGDGDEDRVESGGHYLQDTDADGRYDLRDTDDDGDGIETRLEVQDGIAAEGHDADGDGLADARDPDANDNGVSDGVEGRGDLDQDGVVDYLDADGSRRTNARYDVMLHGSAAYFEPQNRYDGIVVVRTTRGTKALRLKPPEQHAADPLAELRKLLLYVFRCSDVPLATFFPVGSGLDYLPIWDVDPSPEQIVARALSSEGRPVNVRVTLRDLGLVVLDARARPYGEKALPVLPEARVAFVVVVDVEGARVPMVASAQATFFGVPAAGGGLALTLSGPLTVRAVAEPDQLPRGLGSLEVDVRLMPDAAIWVPN